MASDVCVQSSGKANANVSVFEAVLWTHDEFAINYFVYIAVVGESLQILFAPLPSALCRGRSHIAILSGRLGRVEEVGRGQK
jgi:hypothetical protein